jgi:hypothetical protein
MKAKTQIEAIKHLFRTKKKVNILTCFTHTGCMRLSARIYNLKKLGWTFGVEKVTFKTRYGTSGHYNNYTLITEPKDK